MACYVIETKIMPSIQAKWNCFKILMMALSSSIQNLKTPILIVSKKQINIMNFCWQQSISFSPRKKKLGILCYFSIFVTASELPY